MVCQDVTILLKSLVIHMDRIFGKLRLIRQPLVIGMCLKLYSKFGRSRKMNNAFYGAPKAVVPKLVYVR